MACRSSLYLHVLRMRIVRMVREVHRGTLSVTGQRYGRINRDGLRDKCAEPVAVIQTVLTHSHPLSGKAFCESFGLSGLYFDSSGVLGKHRFTSTVLTVSMDKYGIHLLV